MAARSFSRHALTALLGLLALLAACASAPVAHAQAPAGGWGDEPPVSADGWYDDAWGDEGWDDGDDGDWRDPSDMVPGGGAPAGMPPGVELPARPWTPPAPETPTLPVPKGKMVKGKRALVRADGRAAIPRGAPKRVRVAIAAANKIIGKPYKWGGGHGRLVDSGYDCSGTVGYSLVHAGLMRGVMVSGQMARWGRSGGGRWITVYANQGHVYMEIAGLRLDTSPVGDATRRKGVRWRPVIGRRGGFAARHPAGL